MYLLLFLYFIKKYQVYGNGNPRYNVNLIKDKLF